MSLVLEEYHYYIHQQLQDLGHIDRYIGTSRYIIALTSLVSGVDTQ